MKINKSHQVIYRQNLALMWILSRQRKLLRHNSREHVSIWICLLVSLCIPCSYTCSVDQGRSWTALHGSGEWGRCEEMLSSFSSLFSSSFSLFISIYLFLTTRSTLPKSLKAHLPQTSKQPSVTHAFEGSHHFIRASSQHALATTC